MRHIQENNIKVWQYFSLVIALITIGTAFLLRPNSSQLNGIQKEIKATNLAISQARKQSRLNSSQKIETFDFVRAETMANHQLTANLEMALGGYQNSSEFNSKRSKMNKLFGKKLTTELYKLNGNPEITYEAADNSKFKFMIPKKGIANVGFANVTDPQHAQACAIIRYTPNYLSYGLIKIINFDYNLQKQTINSATIDNLKNVQLTGYYDTKN